MTDAQIYAVAGLVARIEPLAGLGTAEDTHT